MQIYWCSECNTPVIYNKIEQNLAEFDPYIDIEDEVLDWIYTNNYGEEKFRYFLSLKKKVNHAISNKNENRLAAEFETIIEHNSEHVLKVLNQYALKYLYFKLLNSDEERLKDLDESVYDRLKFKAEPKKEYCPKCNHGLKYMSKDIRPVFMEERVLLSTLLGEDLRDKNIWNGSGNRYIIDGETSDIVISDFYDLDDLDNKINEVYENLKREERQVGFSNFIEVNREHYQKIEKEAMEFIEIAKVVFEDRKHIVSFSGGKDSTVTSDLVTRAFGTKGVIHIFGDTTMEFPFTYDYVDRFMSQPKHPPFLNVDTVEEAAAIMGEEIDDDESQFFKLSNKFGPPSRVMSWCCTIFKTGPIGNLFREIAEYEDIFTYYGIRRSESNSRSNYDKISKSPKISKQLVASPIIDWTDADIWLYLLSRGIDFNDAYKYGFTRVGCLYCPNNSRWSEFLFKIFMKEDTNKWRDFLIDFAKKIGKPDPEVYVDSGKWKARQGGRGLAKEEVAATLLESEICGMEESATNYDLTKPISDVLYELFKPFGLVVKADKKLGEVHIYDLKFKDENLPNQDIEPLFSLIGREGSKRLKVRLRSVKNHMLTLQRIECQLRKYQTCISCSACANICPYDAIDLLDGYKIDDDKCRRCGKCIAYFHKGCLVVKTTMDY